MNFEIKLAWKYFRSRRKSLARFTAAAAIAGIACGVASLIVAQSLSRGFSSEMQEKILANTAHVTVFQTNGESIDNWRLIKREIEKIESVRQVSPATYQSALAASEKTATYVVLRAFQKSDTEEHNAEADNKINIDNKIIEISIGAELAEKTNLKPGDEADVIVPRAGETPQKSRVRVVEIFRTGIFDYDATWIRLSPADFARASGENAFAPGFFSVSVADVYRAEDAARKIRAALPPNFKAISWQEANQPLFAALSLEKKFSLAIISLVILIAVLNITTTLFLLVNERRSDIAVLRACGARARSLIFIFLLEGAYLSLAGIFCGVSLGLAACFFGNRFRLVRLPSEIYSLTFVPLYPNLADVFLIALIAFSLGLAATVYPARRASQIKPLENLRIGR